MGQLGGAVRAAGRAEKRAYYWANQKDAWQGTTHRDNTLMRWAGHLQNDFRARLDWCVKDYAGADRRRARSWPAPRFARQSRARSWNSTPAPAMTPMATACRTSGCTTPSPARTAASRFTSKVPTPPPPASLPPALSDRKRFTSSSLFPTTATPPLSRYRRIVVTVQP